MSYVHFPLGGYNDKFVTISMVRTPLPEEMEDITKLVQEYVRDVIHNRTFEHHSGIAMLEVFAKKLLPYGGLSRRVLAERERVPAICLYTPWHDFSVCVSQDGQPIDLMSAALESYIVKILSDFNKENIGETQHTYILDLFFAKLREAEMKVRVNLMHPGVRGLVWQCVPEIETITVPVGPDSGWRGLKSHTVTHVIHNNFYFQAPTHDIILSVSADFSKAEILGTAVWNIPQLQEWLPESVRVNS